MRSIVSLIKKEVEQLSVIFIISTLIIAFWEWFLITRTEQWPPGVSFGLGFIPLFFLPLIMIFLAYNSYKSEWGNNTIYLLKILPRRGYEINLGKFLPAFIYYLLLSTSLIAANLYFNQELITQIFNEAPQMVGWQMSRQVLILSYSAYLVTGIQLYLITQFSYIIASFYNRFRLLISILVFILSNYLVIRLGAFTNYLFGWLADFPLTVLRESPTGTAESILYIGSAPFASVLLLMTALFFLNSYLIATEVDV